MNLLHFYLVHNLLGMAMATPFYFVHLRREEEKIFECARLMGHFNNDFHDNVYKSKGCEIKKHFTKGLKHILSGVNITEDQVAVSFKKPIQYVNFQVPEQWAEEKSRHKKRGLLGLFDSKEDVETLPYMFTTQDGRFLISPISKLEFQANDESFGKYIKHMQTNPDSLLVRIIGMFSVDGMYFVAYVSPFNTLLGSNHIVLEFSHESSKANDPKRLGKYPFGGVEWGKLTEHTALLLTPEDEQRFAISYEKDMEFLRNNNYIKYEILIAVPSGIDIKNEEQIYNSYFSVYLQNNVYPISIAITHFFKQSKNEEVVHVYSDSLEIFRKSKVLYGLTARKSFSRRKKP